MLFATRSSQPEERKRKKRTMLKPKPITDVLRRVQKLKVSSPRLIDDEMSARLLGVEQALLFVLERESHVGTWLEELERRVADTTKVQ